MNLATSNHQPPASGHSCPKPHGRVSEELVESQDAEEAPDIEEAPDAKQ